MQSRRTIPGRPRGAPGPKAAFDPARRAFLKSGAALSALAGGTLVPSLGMAQTPLAVPEWMKQQGSPILTPPYGLP